MKRIRILLFGLFVCCSSFLEAASNLGWGQTVYSADTLDLGDTLFISTYLKNYDSAPYNDSIRFGLKINGVLNVSQSIFPNPFLGQQVNVPPNGDSIAVNLIIVITPSYFLVGPDILVVWPIAKDNSQAHDSLIKTIIVRDPFATSVADDEIQNKLKAFCADGHIFIRNEAEWINLNRVRIYSLSGQVILDELLVDNSTIPFNGEPGIYFAEITFNATERRVLKFISF